MKTNVNNRPIWCCSNLLNLAIIFRTILLLSGNWFVLSPLHAQTGQVTSHAEVSLLTCSPGNEIYSYFGHCAIRVKDINTNYDKVYNYGTFSFDQPNFYTKFIRGKLMYQLSVNTFSRFVSEYESEDRWVIEQVLNLSPADKQVFIEKLTINARRENRQYLYDFFFDNCATRPRDLLENSLPNRIFFSENTEGSDLSFRELIDPYITRNAWVDFGIDLILGLPTDRKATAREYMFLPDYLMNAFANAQITDSLGRKMPLVKEVRQVVDAKLPPDPKILFTPVLIFAFIFIAGVLFSIFQLKKKSFHPAFDVIFFGLLGGVGILILFLWFGTDHQVLAFNLNLFWAFPLHLIAAALLLLRNTPNWVGVYFGAVALIGVLILLLWIWLPQQLHHSLIFIVALMTLRASVLYKVYRASLKSEAIQT
ncbi:MAG: DUF4105 domain-containing protein [Sphingobacteriales bacterium]|nr:MAG: DUF4105 domain-containing protein [Sphingobacteriales bacterium]